MKKLIFFFAMGYLLCACNPKITTSVLKKYPALNDTAFVAVYKDSNKVPSKWVTLGNVSAKDGGSTMKCDSSTMINLVKQEARKLGGNAVYINNHLRPSFKSSCHQFDATVLRINATANDSTLAADTQYWQKSISSSPVKAKPPVATLGFNAGWGWRTAEIATNLSPQQRAVFEDLMNGWSFDIFGDYYFTDYIGMRLVYSQYNANTDKDLQNYQGEILAKPNDRILFVGPAFMLRLSSANAKWLFNLGIGVGYNRFKEKFTLKDYNNINASFSGNTVGGYFALGVDYRFDKNWGIGLNYSAIAGALNEMTMEANGHKSTIELEEDEREGIGVGNLQLGLRYYFNKK